MRFAAATESTRKPMSRHCQLHDPQPEHAWSNPSTGGSRVRRATVGNPETRNDMTSFVWIKVLESAPQRYDRGIAMLSGGRITEAHERIAALA
jgi:hypothetical protein